MEEGTDVRRVAVNTAAQFGSYALNNLLATLVAIVVIRHLGRTDYGLMAFVVSYISFFQILTSFGADTVVIREVARHPERAEKLVGGALGLRLALSAITMVVSWIAAPFVAADTRAFRLIVIESLTFLFSFSGLYLVLFNVQLRSHIPNGVLAVWSLIYTLLRLALVALGGRVEHFLAADVVSAAVSLLLSRWVAARYANLRPRFRWDRPLWRMLLSEGWAIALAGWLIALHLRVDQMLLFRMKGPTELGGYAVAVRLSEIWNMLSTVFMVSVFPLLSRFAVDEGERLKRTSTLAYRYLYLLICPIALGIGYYARPLISLLFGPTFADAAPTLGLLAVAEVFFFSHSVSYNVFFAMNRQREAALIAGLSLTANALLNLAWIPAWGAIGAAAASVVSYATVPVLALFFPALRWTAATSLSTLVPPAAAALGAGLALLALRPGPLVGAAVVALVYPALLWVLGGFGKADVDLARRALAGRKG